MTTYQPIPNHFRKDGFDFNLLDRRGLVALFHKTKKPRIESFEVVVLVEAEEREFPNGLKSPAKEIMPASEQWGQKGWTCTNLEDAKAKFEEWSERFNTPSEHSA